MKNIQDIQKKIDAIYNEDLKENGGVSGISILVSGEILGASLSGTHEEIYTGIAQFLIDQPDYIQVFDYAVSCAKKFHFSGNDNIVKPIAEA